MRRGDIYVAAARGAYTGKPRPVVIIQDNRFDATGSIMVCPLTTSKVDAPLIRLPVSADDLTGLAVPSWLMVDKITAVPKTNLGERLGRLSDADLLALARSIVVFLGLAG